MGFWLFMLLMNVSIPMLMIGFGKVFINHPPKDINSFYGYRTKRSKASQEAWNYAHQHFGKVWYRLGLVLVPLTIFVMLPVLGKEIEMIGCYGGAVCMILCVLLIVPIFWTEAELKRKFK